ncbi:hypothetical protein ACP70R_023054 [Stipagrostis hirtigluma subsp. patula]
MRSPRRHARPAAAPSQSAMNQPAPHTTITTAEMKKEPSSVIMTACTAAVGGASGSVAAGPTEPFSPAHRREHITVPASVPCSLGSVFGQARSALSDSSADNTFQSNPLCPRCGRGAASCYWNNVSNEGKSFVKVIGGPFAVRLVFCREFSDKFTGKIGPWVSLKSNSGKWYTVRVSMDDGVHVFDEGWPAVAETESLWPGDFAVFTYVSRYEMAMHLYHDSGIEKASTIVAYPRDICVVPNKGVGSASCDAIPVDETAKSHDVEGAPMPNKKRTEALALERGKGVVLDDDQFGRVLQIWKDRRADFPLYVSTLSATAASDQMYFSKRFSEFLPKRRTAVKMRMSHTHGVSESHMKVFSDSIARIGKGWGSLVQKNGLREGDTCLFKFRKQSRCLRLKIFKL